MRLRTITRSHRSRVPWAAAAAIAVAAWGPCNGEDKAETAAKQVAVLASAIDITGKYSCTLTQNTVPMMTTGSQSTISVCKDDKGYAIWFLGGTVQSPYGPMRMPDGPKIRIQVQGNKFTFTLNPMPGERIVGSALSNVQSTVVLEQKYFNLGQHLGTATFTCSYVEPCKDNLRRAVFIRPCEGQLYANGAFGILGRPTRVGGGTLWNVCTDLKASGVTDIFLPFKVDHEGKGCGDSGELLYDSGGYDTHENARFQTARATGFDPIKKLMDTCKEVYKKAGKKVKFHAWFPVFNDRKAANIEGVEARKPWFGIIDIFSPTMRSTVFADPTHPTVSVYELALLKEIVDAYKVDGINLDYIRYPGPNEGDIPGDYVVQVNANAVTEFVRKVREQFPNVELSADVMAGEARRISIGQNDMVSILESIIPMMYTAPFYDLTHDQVTQRSADLRVKYPKSTVLPVLRGWVCIEETQNNSTGCSKTETPEDTKNNLKADIQAAKEGGAQGHGIFTYEALISETHTTRLKDIRKEINY